MSNVNPQTILALLIVAIVILLVIFLFYRNSYIPVAPIKCWLRLSASEGISMPSPIQKFVEDVNSSGLVVDHPRCSFEVVPFDEKNFKDSPALSLFTIVPAGWSVMSYLRWLLDQGGLNLLNALLKSEDAVAFPAGFEISMTPRPPRLCYALLSLKDWNGLSKDSQQNLIRFAKSNLLDSCISTTESYIQSPNYYPLVNDVKDSQAMSTLPSSPRLLQLHSRTSNLIKSSPSYAQVLLHQTRAGAVLNSHQGVEGYSIVEDAKDFHWPIATTFYQHVYNLSLGEFLSLGEWLEREFKKAMSYPQASLIQGFIWRQGILVLITRRPSIPLLDLLKQKTSTTSLTGMVVHLWPVSNALCQLQQRLRNSNIDVKGYGKLFTVQTIVFSSDIDALSATCASAPPYKNLKRRKPLHVAFVNVFSNGSSGDYSCPIEFAGSQKVNLEEVCKTPEVFSGTFEQGYSEAWNPFLTQNSWDTCQAINIHWDHFKRWVERAQRGEMEIVYVGWTERGEMVAGTRNTFEDARRCFT
jgi:hypothetical protein